MNDLVDFIVSHPLPFLMLFSILTAIILSGGGK